MTLPNFIVIGPGKTGTTWLYTCLRAHPQIRLARHTKETAFFTEFFSRGPAWYENFFKGCEGAAAIGEVSNTYFFSADAAARIAALLPEVRLIVFLRHPIDRLVSWYLFQRRNGAMPGSLEDAIARDPGIVSQNFFDEHLEAWLSHFPRAHIFVALYDDLERDPQALLREVYRFLGVDAGFMPKAAGRRALEAGMPRSTVLNRMLKRLARWLRRRDMHAILNLKNNALVAKLLTRRLAEEEKAILSPETRRRLLELYRPHIARTAALTGRDLSAWT